MNKIPPVDLARQYKLIKEEVGTAVLDLLDSGRYIGGAAVTDFEQQFAAYLGVDWAVSCNSGTDALYLALRALKIGAGDEVITTPFTFIATAEAIASVGAKPVFVDIDPQTFNLDVERLTAAITQQTKAIIPVHLFGQPANMTPLIKVAKANNLFVIEDCAQATGAEWGDVKVGSIGDVGCFSFYPTKNLAACGDGGMATTNNPEIAAQMRMVADHGRSDRYYHEVNGINSRLDSIQAAILQVKLTYLDRWNQQRNQLAQQYHQLLENLPGIQLPQVLPAAKSVWNQYTIRVNCQEKTPQLRDKIRQQLGELGITTMVYYPLPLHLQPVYQKLGSQPGNFPITEQTANEVLSLPMFPELTFTEQQQVVYALKDCLVEVNSYASLS
ncbi:MAG: DegT/DnrJ/EryC1/StrS family aminotransferase [Oscillatoria sp. PMC 1068.18]|nr:DegT/DnrJ/EryC1/StrS family aminotransferase [Oscillatoria sp. PMC 1076.18]MEC4991804.1 DegT/DnrJ/EryC1/StrS family aminotransferase [Oscillatoria sp. PMC 1068.18]